MNRRDWLKSAGALGVAATLPLERVAAAVPQAAQPGRNRLEMEIRRLNLRHTWTTTMSASTYRDTLFVRFTRDGVTGFGEGAPIVRYDEDAKGGQQALEGLRAMIETADPWQFNQFMQQVFARLEGQKAAKAALDIALMDWVGKKLNVPIYRYYGLNPQQAPVTTFSIGIDTPEITRQKTREAAAFPVLKIKVGLATDEPTIEAVRSVTDKPLRVDANEGWTNREEAVRKINWLATKGVEFVEQPMPADRLDDIAWVKQRVSLPLFADETVTHPDVIPKLVGIFDGINVKLDKAGGVQEAYRWISMAKSLGFKTMLGCMVSSSCSVTAAAHLSPLCDYADLDGNLLIANDPFTGVTVKEGKLVLPNGPGLGLKPARG